MSDVELTIQISMETDDETMAVLVREAKSSVKKALQQSQGQAEYVHETQWCSGVMRVVVRRPNVLPEA